MASTLEHLDETGLTIYAKPLPLATPWGDDVVVLSEGQSGYYSASVDPAADGYAVYEHAGASPASSDGPAIASIDTAVSTHSAADVWTNATRGLTEAVETDQPSRDASKATGFSTHSAAEVGNEITNDHGVGSYVDSGSADLSDLQDDVSTLINRTDDGVEITSQSPVAQDGSLDPIVQGDSYLATDGRQFEWTLENHGLELANATTRFTLADLSSTHTESVQGTITEDGSDATLTFDLAADKSANLKVGELRYGWDVQITLANPSRPVTPVRGRATVLPQYT